MQHMSNTVPRSPKTGIWFHFANGTSMCGWWCECGPWGLTTIFGAASVPGWFAVRMAERTAGIQSAVVFSALGLGGFWWGVAFPNLATFNELVLLIGRTVRTSTIFFGAYSHSRENVSSSDPYPETQFVTVSDSDMTYQLETCVI